ncbi:MAG: GNAT family N-acetyltransferase [Patescibacteria group bacterium]
MSANREVSLRPFTRDDLPSMVRWNNDPEVEYYVDCDLPKTLPDCERWFRANIPSRDYRLYAIEDERGRLIGDLELDHISWRNREAEFRIRIGEKTYWNNGYGTAAVRKLLGLALTELGLHRIYLRVYRFNRRAIRCYEKCGFRKRGLLRRTGRHAAGWKDIILMTILIDAAREAAAGSE